MTSSLDVSTVNTKTVLLIRMISFDGFTVIFPFVKVQLIIVLDYLFYVNDFIIVIINHYNFLTNVEVLSVFTSFIGLITRCEYPWLHFIIEFKIWSKLYESRTRCCKIKEINFDEFHIGSHNKMILLYKINHL